MKQVKALLTTLSVVFVLVALMVFGSWKASITGETTLECGNGVCEPEEAKTCPEDCNASIDKNISELVLDQKIIEINGSSAVTLIVLMALGAFVLFYWDKVRRDSTKKIKKLGKPVKSALKKTVRPKKSK